METKTIFDDYLFRCSSLGKLMTGVKPSLTENQKQLLSSLQEKQESNKITEKQLITLGDLLERKHAKPELSETTKNYLKELHKELLFHRSSEIRNKYCDKGIQVEEKSLSLYSNFIGFPFYKNKERFNNEYLTGEPDNVSEVVRDIKSSWDFSTFPMYATEIPNKDYEWQLLGYLELTKKEKAELIYCLVDTPFKIIDDELRRLDWKENIMTSMGDIKEFSIPLVVELVSSMIYTQKGLEEYCQQSSQVNIEWFENFREVPETLRIKTFTVNYDKEKITALYNQIKLCREYLNDLSLSIAEKLEVDN